ncbi:MAG: PAS domain S-box protein, partial [Desulfatitalea sp.]
MAPTPMSKDICCQNFKGLTAYIRKHYGDRGFEKLTEGLLCDAYFVQDKYQPSIIIPIKEEHLVDQAYWVSNEFSLKLLHNVNNVVEAERPLRAAGRGVVTESLSKTSLFFAKFLGLKSVANRVAQINRRFNKTKDVKLTDFGANSARFELNYKPGFTVTKDVCEWNLGIYIGITELSGQKQVDGRETHCILNGDNCCCFEINWKKQNLLTRVPKTIFTSIQRSLLKDLTADYERILEERDQLIQNLEKSEKKYRTLFEESQEALSLSQKGKLIDVNPSWLKLHGYSNKDDVIGKSAITFVHPDDRRVLSIRHKNWPENYKRMVELRDVTQSGQIIDVEVYSSRIEYSGNQSILAMVKDVTEHKRAEENKKKLEARVVRAEKMETLATLAGGVAHDLNNILSGIVGYPELILMQLPDDSPLKRPIETMHQSAKKAAAIVQDLLTLSRRGAMSMAVINLNTIVREYIDSPEFEKMLSYLPKVSVKIDLEDDLVNFNGSTVHVSKTLMNLLSNAAEAMPEGGTVCVTTQNCYVDKQLQEYERIKEGEYCVLSVADTGVGISEADQDKIFEPFFTKKKMGRSGTGLGLTVVWGSVKDHGGYIDVKSELCKGTEIKVYFPATRACAAENESRIDLSTLKGHGEKILIVDDIKEQLEIAKDMLGSLNYRTVAVESGEEAVEYLVTNACDLILLDMIMSPGMDGLETCKEIVRNNPHQKVILASGYSETDRVKEALRIG